MYLVLSCATHCAPQISFFIFEALLRPENTCTRNRDGGVLLLLVEERRKTYRRKRYDLLLQRNTTCPHDHQPPLLVYLPEE